MTESRRARWVWRAVKVSGGLGSPPLGAYYYLDPAKEDAVEDMIVGAILGLLLYAVAAVFFRVLLPWSARYGLLLIVLFYAVSMLSNEFIAFVCFRLLLVMLLAAGLAAACEAATAPLSRTPTDDRPR